jgi:hypothetical protein
VLGAMKKETFLKGIQFSPVKLTDPEIDGLWKVYQDFIEPYPEPTNQYEQAWRFSQSFFIGYAVNRPIVFPMLRVIADGIGFTKKDSDAIAGLISKIRQGRQDPTQADLTGIINHMSDVLVGVHCLSRKWQFHQFLEELNDAGQDNKIGMIFDESPFRGRVVKQYLKGSGQYDALNETAKVVIKLADKLKVCRQQLKGDMSEDQKLKALSQLLTPNPDHFPIQKYYQYLPPSHKKLLWECVNRLFHTKPENEYREHFSKPLTVIVQMIGWFAFKTVVVEQLKLKKDEIKVINRFAKSIDQVSSLSDAQSLFNGQGYADLKQLISNHKVNIIESIRSFNHGSDVGKILAKSGFRGWLVSCLLYLVGVDKKINAGLERVAQKLDDNDKPTLHLQ